MHDQADKKGDSQRGIHQKNDCAYVPLCVETAKQIHEYVLKESELAYIVMRTSVNCEWL